MKARAVLGFLVLGLATLHAADPSPSTLIWRQGESLPGRLLSATADTVLFHPQLKDSPQLFPEPVELRLAHLSEWHQEASPPPSQRTEAFELRLNDGTRLLADLIGLDQDWLRLRSAWLGAFAVQKSQVLALNRVRGEGLLFSSGDPETRWTESLRLERPEDPFADPFAAFEQPQARVLRVSRSARSTANPGEEPQLWRRLPQGGFSTLSWSNLLSSPLPPETPDLMRLDVRISSQSRPQFVFSLAFPDADLKMETWQDRLVLRLGSRFAAAARPLPASAADLTLTVLWDRRQGTARLLDERGQEIASLTADASTPPGLEPSKASSRQPKPERPAQPLLSLENLGLDLDLHKVTLTRWDGQPPPSLSSTTTTGAILLNGRYLQGDLAACDGTSITLSDGRKAPLNQVLTLQVQPTTAEAPAATDTTARVRVRSQAGETIDATFAGIEAAAEAEKSPHVQLRHAAFQSPLLASLTGTQSMVWHEVTPLTEPPATAPDRLRAGQHLISGQWTFTGEPMPRWLFEGALAATPLDPTAQVVLERDEKRFTELPTASGQVLLQLKRGDLIAARLQELRADGLRFTAPGMMLSSLPAQELDAVHFPGQPLNPTGFADPDWRWLHPGSDGPPLDAPEGLTLSPGKVLAHPSMFAGGQIEFTLDDESRMGMTCLRLGLGAQLSHPQGEHLKLLIALVGDEIYCGDEAGEGQMRRQNQLPYAGDPVRVQIRLHQDRLLVRLNGQQALSLELNGSMRPGSGLILEGSGLWGNPPQTLRLKDFHARQPLQRLRVTAAEEVAKLQALTIPRLRLDAPPAHVLIAPSGDLLRGTINELTEKEVVMQWGLETFRVARERLAAVVLLDSTSLSADNDSDKTATAPPATPAPGPAPHWLLLADGSRLGLQLLSWEADAVTGLHPRLGRVRVPESSIQSLWSQAPPPLPDAMTAVTGWKPIAAAAPDLPEATTTESPLLGKDAADFTAPLLEGGEFQLQAQRGRVVVLDFWASWCGPCVRGLPELMAALKELPSDQVRLVGVNQGEPEAHVRTFLQTRQWPLLTVLDKDQAVGRLFAVESIPHTVVIAPDGRVAWVKTGYTPESAREIAAKVAELLEKAR